MRKLRKYIKHIFDLLFDLLQDPFGPDSIAKPWPTAKELAKKGSCFHKAVKEFYDNQKRIKKDNQKDSSKKN